MTLRAIVMAVSLVASVGGSNVACSIGSGASDSDSEDTPITGGKQVARKPPPAEWKLEKLGSTCGTSLYMAMFALEETRSLFLASRWVAEIEGEDTWFYRSEYDSRLGAVQRETIRRKLTEYVGQISVGKASDLLRRLGFWCALDGVFEELAIYRPYSEENLMQAIEADERTRAIVRRRLEPSRLTGSLSSLEMAMIYFDLVTYLSALPEQEQLAYLAYVLTFVTEHET